MWSCVVTKVSKNRQVRRAISRRARTSVAVGKRFANLDDGRLTHWAIAGEANHRIAKRCGEEPRLVSGDPGGHRGGHADQRPRPPSSDSKRRSSASDQWWPGRLASIREGRAA